MGRFAAVNEASLDMPSNCQCRSRQLARIDFVPSRCSRLESASTGTVAWSLPHPERDTLPRGCACLESASMGTVAWSTPHPDRHTVSLGCSRLESASMGTVAWTSPHPERYTLPRGCTCLESGRRRMVTRRDASQRHERFRYSSLRMLEHPFVPLAGNTQSPTRGCLDPPTPATSPTSPTLYIALSANTE